MTEKKIDKFLDTVYSAAEAKSKKTVREIDRAGEAALREYRATLRRSADADFSRERTRAVKSGAETAAHEETEIRRALLSRRSDITDRVFARVKERIEEYCTTDEYREFLIRSAVKIKELFGEDSDACILICARDEVYAAEIEAAAGLSVKTDSSVLLGGLRGVSRDADCDCTLDSAIESAREDFIRESGLSVV